VRRVAGDSPVPNVGKIAVLRANGVGDFVFALPALDALRKAYPSAEIVLLGLPWHESFLHGRPGPVDRVVVVPRYAGVRDEPGAVGGRKEQGSFFEQMRSERFDIVVQMHGGGAHSNPFVRSLGGRLTVGLRDKNAPPLDLHVPYVYYQPEILRFLEVVSLIGARVHTLQPQLAVTREDLLETWRVVPRPAQSIAVIHPGAGDTRRRWPPEKFAAVGDRLSGKGLKVVVTGDSDDKDLADATAGSMRREAINVAGRLSLGGLLGLLSRAEVVVSNDSGPLHLAEAGGARTVGIYWCGNLLNAGPMTRKRHRPAISWRLNCPVCGVDCTKASCEHGQSFVADVPTEEVEGLALDLLSKRSPSSSAAA